MSFGVEYTSEFEYWWNDLDCDEQESIAVIVGFAGRKRYWTWIPLQLRDKEFEL